jgi:hypothetical protein
MVSAYNGTGMTGGDSLTEDLNIWYDVSWKPHDLLYLQGIAKLTLRNLGW